MQQAAHTHESIEDQVADRFFAPDLSVGSGRASVSEYGEADDESHVCLTLGGPCFGFSAHMTAKQARRLAAALNRAAASYEAAHGAQS